MILVFGLPYLMDNSMFLPINIQINMYSQTQANTVLLVDPEVKAEFEQTMKSGSGTKEANAIQNFDAAAWLAGKGKSSGASTPRIEPVERGVSR